MHLGTGLICSSKILDMIEAGFQFTIFLADWHAWINHKLGSSIDNIRVCGEYFIDSFSALGLTRDKVKYTWTSDLVENGEYWRKVIEVGRNASIARLMRCLPIMGRRADSTDVEGAALFYPCMQAADVFALDVDCACAGLDQRKVHMLARDVAEQMGQNKPTCVHTPLLAGLLGPSKMGAVFDEDPTINLKVSSKMSKSVSASCVYIHDSPEVIQRKIKAAYCPPKQTALNPIMEIVRYVLFSRGNASLRVKRSAEFGGTVEFSSYGELESAYASGKLHPLDLKNSVSDALIVKLQPVRDYFAARSGIIDNIREMEI